MAGWTELLLGTGALARCLVGKWLGFNKGLMMVSAEPSIRTQAAQTGWGKGSGGSEGLMPWDRQRGDPPCPCCKREQFRGHTWECFEGAIYRSVTPGLLPVHQTALVRDRKKDRQRWDIHRQLGWGQMPRTQRLCRHCQKRCVCTILVETKLWVSAMMELVEVNYWPHLPILQ